MVFLDSRYQATRVPKPVARWEACIRLGRMHSQSGRVHSMQNRYANATGHAYRLS